MAYKFKSELPDEKDLQLRSYSRQYVAPEKQPWIPLIEERVRIVAAHCENMVADAASNKWIGKPEGKKRVEQKDNGTIVVRGTKDTYLVCPYKMMVYDETGENDYDFRLADSTLSNADLVPAGSDLQLRRTTAIIEMLTKDDRLGNNHLKLRSV